MAGSHIGERWSRTTWLCLDLAFGMLLPVVCWRVNHVLIGDRFDGGGLLALNFGGAVAGFIWLLTLVVAMLLRTVFRPRSFVLAGVLKACAVWAVVFGVFLIPFGILSFFALGPLSPLLFVAPFGAALVCLRASRETREAAAQRSARGGVIALTAAVLTAAVTTGTGYAARGFVQASIERLADASQTEHDALVSRLDALRPVLNLAGKDPAEDIARAWYFAVGRDCVAEEGSRGDALSRAYTRLTRRPVGTSEAVARLYSGS